MDSCHWLSLESGEEGLSESEIHPQQVGAFCDCCQAGRSFLGVNAP